MNNKKELFPLIIILVIAGFLRFFSLMHDSPYFFNPDERNMANAVSQFRLPGRLSEIPNCLIGQFIQPPTTNHQPPTNNCNLNPRFFAYGQFPLYLAFASDQITQLPLLFLPTTNYQPPTTNYLSTSFPSSIYWLRFWSTLLSTITVLFVYLISKELLKRVLPQLPTTNYQLPTISAVLAAFTPGLIQSAHFGTTESFLTFFFLASIYLSFKLIEKPIHLPARGWSALGGKFILLTSLTIGLALGSKLTGIFFFVPPFISLIIRIIDLFATKGKKKIISGLFVYLLIGLLVLIGSITVFIISSPYNLVDPADFKSAVFGYESDVAMGRYEAFYTRQFVNTNPVIFQAEKIFPYALGWPVFILGTLGFLLMNLKLIQYAILPILQRYQRSKIKYQRYISKIKNSNIFNFLYVFFIFDISFLIYFIPNAFLFAKWTRFMTPVFPFFIIFGVYAVNTFYNFFINHTVKVQSSKIKNQRYSVKFKNFKLLALVLIFALCALSLLPGIAFMSMYQNKDTRVQASEWIYQNIPGNSYILSETANVIDIPLGLPTTNHQPPTNNYTVISFDFYHIDENPGPGLSALISHLEKANYIFIPSRRIFANYTRLPKQYPLVTKYYQLLNSGALGFEKVAEINSYPAIGWIKFPDEAAEETFTVFDHPVVRIYRKVKPLTIDQYQSLLEN